VSAPAPPGTLCARASLRASDGEVADRPREARIGSAVESSRYTSDTNINASTGGPCDVLNCCAEFGARSPTPPANNTAVIGT
jgi:hypothetical protein